MTIRTADLGGSDISDGEVDYAADINDTFGAVTIHRKVNSDATERYFAGSSTAWQNSGTAFSIAIPVNALILGVYVSLDLKSSAGRSANANLQLSGSLLGTVYFKKEVYYGDICDDEGELFTVSGGTYIDCRKGFGWFYKNQDATMTGTIRMQKSDDGLGDAYMRNAVVSLVYVEVFKDD